MFTFVVHRLSGPQRGHDLECLLHPGDSNRRFGRADSERRQLLGDRAPPDAEIESAPGGVVDRNGLSGQHRRVPEGVAEHQGTNPQPLRLGRDPGRGHHCLVHRLLEGKRRRKVVHAGEPGEPGGLSRPGLVDELRHGEPHLGQKQVELHGSLSRSGCVSDETSPTSFDAASRSRSSRFSTLPLALSGSAATISTRRGTLKLAIRSRHHRTTSSGSGRQFVRATTNAAVTSPSRGVRHGNDSCLGDVCVLQEHGLDLGRGDVEAADDNDVLLAVDDTEVTVVPQKTDVTGPQPALRVDGRLGSLRDRRNTRSSR